jgi:hypothetical protein
VPCAVKAGGGPTASVGAAISSTHGEAAVLRRAAPCRGPLRHRNARTNSAHLNHDEGEIVVLLRVAKQVDSYLTDHTDARFSHGICPTCMEQALKEIDEGVR